MGIGKRVKRARVLKDLTQTDLANKVHVSQEAIHKLEIGATKRSRFLPEIAEVLDVTVKWLMYGDDKDVGFGTVKEESEDIIPNQQKILENRIYLLEQQVMFFGQQITILMQQQHQRVH